MADGLTTWKSVRVLAACLLGSLMVGCAPAEAPNFKVDLPDDQFSADAKGSAKSLGILAIAPTPKNFPKQSAADVEQMMPKAAEIAGAAVLIYQWGDPNFDKIPSQMIDRARKAGLVVVPALSPTTLDQSRKELDVPRDLKRFGGPSFADKEVQKQYIAAALSLARAKPPYLCLATEINFLGLQRIDEYLKFITLYKEAYKAVKKVSPETKVFVSFQYEFVRIVDNKEPTKVAEHAKLIDAFRPELDLLAITTYPADYYDTPDKMPINYYTHLKKYMKPGEKVMVMEIGWPSAGKGTPAEQKQFIERLPALMNDIQPELTAWSLLHDVKLDAFEAGLSSTGILTSTGEAKESFAAWKKFADEAKK